MIGTAIRSPILLCVSLFAGCPGGDGSSTTIADPTTGSASDSDGTGGTTGTATTEVEATTAEPTAGSTGQPPGTCLGEGEGEAAEGDACAANDDCASGVCVLFTDAPIDDDAVCGPVPANCGMRVTGTIFDFSTGEPVSGATLVVAATSEVASNATGAMPIIEATSDANGRVDETSIMAISGPEGLVGLASAAGYSPTTTSLASPGPDMQTYPVGTGNHDIWLVPEAVLTNWSDQLALDPTIDVADLPLGDAGGVVGFVRDATGAPVAGAAVASASDVSSAVIRYLNDDGTFNDAMTTELGVFVILDPAVPEDFEAAVGGVPIGRGTAEPANGVVFTLVITAD